MHSCDDATLSPLPSWARHEKAFKVRFREREVILCLKENCSSFIKVVNVTWESMTTRRWKAVECCGTLPPSLPPHSIRMGNWLEHEITEHEWWWKVFYWQQYYGKIIIKKSWLGQTLILGWSRKTVLICWYTSNKCICTFRVQTSSQLILILLNKGVKFIMWSNIVSVHETTSSTHTHIFMSMR